MNDNNDEDDPHNDNGHDDDETVTPPGWTVGRLRAALAGLPDTMQIVVYASSESEDGDTEVCGGLYNSQQESHADGTVFLGLHASDVPEDFDFYDEE